MRRRQLEVRTRFAERREGSKTNAARDQSSKLQMEVEPALLGFIRHMHNPSTRTDYECVLCRLSIGSRALRTPSTCDYCRFLLCDIFSCLDPPAPVLQGTSGRTHM